MYVCMTPSPPSTYSGITGRVCIKKNIYIYIYKYSTQPSDLQQPNAQSLGEYNWIHFIHFNWNFQQSCLNGQNTPPPPTARSCGALKPYNLLIRVVFWLSDVFVPSRINLACYIVDIISQLCHFATVPEQRFPAIKEFSYDTLMAELRWKAFFWTLFCDIRNERMF